MANVDSRGATEGREIGGVDGTFGAGRSETASGRNAETCTGLNIAARL